MSHPYGPGAAERIPVELIEADFEIAFSLLDLAGADARLAARAIHDAEDVFRDIESRLQRLGVPGNQPFVPLVGELRRELDLARLQDGEAAA